MGRMIQRVLAAAVLAWPGSLWPVAAATQELAPRYQAIGQLVLTLDGQEQVMVVVHDREKNRSQAKQKMVMGTFHSINLIGHTVDAEGEPGKPMLQVTLQGKGSRFSLLSAEIFDEQGYDAPLAMGEAGAEGQLTGFSLEGDRLEAAIEGDFLRLTGYAKGEPAPAEAAVLQPATIRVEVQLPPMK